MTTAGEGPGHRWSRVLHAGNRDVADAEFARARARRLADATRESYLTYDLMSFAATPWNLERLLEEVRQGDPGALDVAIEWLVVDPFCLHSGYAKQRVMRAVGQRKLSTAQASKLRRLLIDLLTRGRRQEFRDTCRLAGRVAEGAFVAHLRELTHDPDAEVSQRARWMLQRCERQAQEASLVRPSAPDS